MDNRKLLSMAILGVLSATRFTFGISTNLAKTSADFVDDVSSYLSGVKMPNKIGDTLWNSGQKIATKSMDFLQKSVKELGSR